MLGRRVFKGIVFATISATLLLTTPATQVYAQTKKTTGKAAKPQAPMPADIDRNGVLILVRTALLALDNANKTGNYMVLRDIGAPAFQKNTAATLSEIFAAHRRDRLDLGGVAVLDPQLTLLPQIETNGLLHMSGFFPSVPTQVNFELLYAPVERQWKLFGISVNLSNGSPVAPAVDALPEAPPSTELPAPPTPEITVVPQPRPDSQ